MQSTRHNPYETKPSEISTTSTLDPRPSTPKWGLNLGGIKKKATKTESTKPTIPDPTGELGLMVARLRKRREEIEGLESSAKIDSQEIADKSMPYYLEVNAGRLEPENSFLIASPTGSGLVTFPCRYPKINDSASVLPTLKTILHEHVDEFFKVSHTIKIECDSIPLEKQQQIINDIVELFERYHCGDALSTEEVCRPIKEFHAARHRILTREENANLQRLFPITIMVKTEGVKG